MKRNFFGDVIAQPGDDPWMLFEDMGVDMSDNVLAFRHVEEDENFGWTCELETEGGDTMQVHDFESEAALREWLAQHMIEDEI